MTTQHVFQELGYFSQQECKAIKERLQGQSFYNFDIGWSNQAGNCILIVSTEWEKTSEKELKDSFLWLALSLICQLDRQVKYYQGGADNE